MAVENLRHTLIALLVAFAMACTCTIVASAAQHPDVEVEQAHRKTGYSFALKSNLLYDVLSIVNVSAEFPLGKTPLSLQLTQQFPWWRWGDHGNKYCIRDAQTIMELRWNFGVEDEASIYDRSHHILGVYGLAEMYDFQWDRKICKQGELASAGLTYAYVCKTKRRLAIEFSLSAGYARVKYRHYSPSQDYSILIADPERKGVKHYFGPTKAGVSIVIPIITGGLRR